MQDNSIQTPADYHFPELKTGNGLMLSKFLRFFEIHFSSEGVDVRV